MADEATVFRDAALQRAFAERGFVTVKLLDRAEVRDARERLSIVRESCSSADDAVSQVRGYHGSVWHPDSSYRRRAMDLARTILAERVDSLLCGYRFLSGGILIKPPGGKPLGMHRDWTMTADPRQTSLNCWCPLVDVDGGNGALALLPGSHRILADDIHGPGIPAFFGGYGEGLKRLSQIVPLHAGEAVIFDLRMLHWSEANESTEPRLALAGGFVPEAARAILHVRDEKGGRRAIRMIEPEAGAWIDFVANFMASGSFAVALGEAARHRNRSMGRAELERRIKAPGSSPALLAVLRVKDKASMLLSRALRALR
jgi:hypothetical protein